MLALEALAWLPYQDDTHKSRSVNKFVLLEALEALEAFEALEAHGPSNPPHHLQAFPLKTPCRIEVGGRA